jgi:hypothetical protein
LVGETVLPFSKRFLANGAVGPLEAETAEKIKSAINGTGKATAPDTKGKPMMHLNTILTEVKGTGVSLTSRLPRCCTDADVVLGTKTIPVPALVGLYSPSFSITVLIDPGCLQANIVSKRTANKLVTMGAVRRPTKGWVAPGIGTLGGGTGFEHIKKVLTKIGFVPKPIFKNLNSIH